MNPSVPQPDERTRKIKEGRVISGRIGMQLIQEKKAAILSESTAGVEKKDIQGRDILTLLLKANLATDIPDNQRISDDEVLARMCRSSVSIHSVSLLINARVSRDWKVGFLKRDRHSCR